jgi:hypothetical protein
MKIISLKPSYFLIHDVKHSGGIHYRIADRETTEEGRTERATWNTTRTIEDKAAFDAARATRARIESIMKQETGAAVSDITGGLFAPATPDTLDAIRRANERITEEIDAYSRDHDGGNRLTSRIIVFKIEGENKALLEAITGQISDALRDLKSAVERADFAAIRAALKSVKGLEKILPDEKAQALTGLVEGMRARARELSKAVNKQGLTLDQITALRDAAPVDMAALEILEAPGALDMSAPDGGALETDQTPDAAPAPALATFDAAELETDQTPDAPAGAPAPALDARALETDQTSARTRADDWKEETPAA